MQDQGDIQFLGSVLSEVERKYGECFYGPRVWPTEADFIPHDEAFNVVLSGLEQSNLFVLYYPERVVSGALVELGVAIALNKPVLIYTKDIDNITYFMRGHRDLVTDPNLIMPWIDNQMSVMV